MGFFLRPLYGLLFKAFGWASFLGLWMDFFLRPLDRLFPKAFGWASI